MAVAANGDEIVFSSEAFPEERPTTIALQSPLPVIGASDLTIDGSQRGPVIDGSAIQRCEDRPIVGLNISGGHNVRVMGLQLTGFEVGIALHSGAQECTVGGRRNIEGGLLGSGNVLGGNRFGVIINGPITSDNTVVGNFIGTTSTGFEVSPNEQGVQIEQGATHNTVGSLRPELGNIISGNSRFGVVLIGSGTSQNKIIGNFVGTDASGMKPLGNGLDGVTIQDGASNNLVGGDASGAANVISGNRGGISLFQAGVSGNVISSNLIGTDAAGKGSLANSIVGVFIGADATRNVVGGNRDRQGNVISGNGVNGVEVGFVGADQNIVTGNIIGLDRDGRIAIGNLGNGISVHSGAKANRIGGSIHTERNVISGNRNFGIAIGVDNTSENTIRGNFIGVDTTGAISIGVQTVGVSIQDGAHDNIVGGAEDGEHNVISGNRFVGVYLNGPRTVDNQVLGNFIGSDMNGRERIGNASVGVHIDGGASRNVIGGLKHRTRNVISGNSRQGILISGANTSDNQIIGNLIGPKPDGQSQMESAQDTGVSIGFEATGNVIGPDNTISGNGAGVSIVGRRCTSNRVVGNRIGTDATGRLPLANDALGVGISRGASNNQIGSPQNPNVISGNDVGVFIVEDGSDDNVVRGNHIGTDMTGARAIPNGAGILFGRGASRAIIGGSTPEDGNLVSGNLNAGIGTIELESNDSGDYHHKISSNRIGVDISGLEAVPNGIGIGLLRLSDVTIDANVLSGNDLAGIMITATRRVSIARNRIGTGSDDVRRLGNGIAGIAMMFTDRASVGSGSREGVNIIANNGEHGVIIRGATRNTVSFNSIFDNRLGALYAPESPVQPPVVERYDVTSRTILGRTCARCTVELYGNTSPNMDMTALVVQSRSDDSGVFKGQMPMVSNYPYITAITQDTNGVMSELSRPFRVSNRHALALPLLANTFIFERRSSFIR